jgi:ubiquitin-like-conjugating enzyme ATG3
MVRATRVACCVLQSFTVYREKGESSKTRDYLPDSKQYLVTHGGLSCYTQPLRVTYFAASVPCLRRATSLAYTDADEDAERLISFADGGSKDKDDEWVETHAGRSLHMSSHY